MVRLDNGMEIGHSDVPYDPVKAHEYYIRTRKLKGRPGGSGNAGDNWGGSHQKSYTLKGTNGKTYKINSAQYQEQKAYASAVVSQLTVKVHELGKLLQEKLDKAKKSAAPPTAAEKAKAVRDAKTYRQAHKQTIATKAKAKAATAPKKSAQKTDTVASITNQINDTKAHLKSAIAKQREILAAKANG